MCGSDYPYFRRDLAVGCIAALRHTEELAASEREAVLGANALKLFPRVFADMRSADRPRTCSTVIGEWHRNARTVSGLIMFAALPSTSGCTPDNCEGQHVLGLRTVARNERRHDRRGPNP